MTIKELEEYIEKQVENILICSIDVNPYIESAIERTKCCLSYFASKHYNDCKNEVPFSVFNTVHYSILLYSLSRIAFEMDQSGENAEKFYYLNKILNAVDIFYEIEFPTIWGVEHPVGSVMGRANYSDFFYFYQGCTVGTNNKYSADGSYVCYHPNIGVNVVMYSNSKILGSSNIGNNVIVSANTYIINQNVPDNSIVFGQSPNIKIILKEENEIKNRLVDIWKYDI